MDALSKAFPCFNTVDIVLFFDEPCKIRKNSRYKTVLSVLYNMSSKDMGDFIHVALMIFESPTINTFSYSLPCQFFQVKQNLRKIWIQM